MVTAEYTGQSSREEKVAGRNSGGECNVAESSTHCDKMHFTKFMPPLLYLFALLPLANAADNDRFARLVLFSDAEAETPENYETRFRSLAMKKERFKSPWQKGNY